MKKTYQYPEIQIIMMQTRPMMAGSVSMFGQDANSEGMSRGSDSFFEDEEEY